MNRCGYAVSCHSVTAAALGRVHRNARGVEFPAVVASHGFRDKLSPVETAQQDALLKSAQSVKDDAIMPFIHAVTKRVTDEALVVELQRQIRTRFLRQWRELRVVSVVRDKETVYIEVDGEGATWCVNICPPRDHAASRIYFSVDKHGISQRCFCRSEKVPYFKSLCKSFVSTPKPLDKWMVDKLFPKPVVAREG